MADVWMEIQKMHPVAGDLVIIRCAEDDTEDIHNALQHFPEGMADRGVTYWVLPTDVTVEVLQPEEKERLRRFLNEGVHPIP